MTDLSTENLDASNAQAGSTEADQHVSLENSIDAAFATVDGRDDDAPAGDDVQATDDVANVDVIETPETPADPVALTAPDRFSSAAKELWANTPPAMQGEIERMRTELESGLTQKDEQLAKYSGLEDLQQLAESQGQTLADVAKNYAGIEDILRKDPIAGFRQIAQNLGLNFNNVAAHVMNRRPNQQAAQYENEINGLKTELRGMKLQFQNIEQANTEQTNAALQGEIETFAKDHEHFETVRADMGKLIQSGLATDLPTAYEQAAKMRGLAVSPNTVKAVNTKDDLAAQTQKGQLSVDGAPRSGSKPDRAKPSKSASEAIERAFANIG